MDNGWIKLHRKILQSIIFSSEKGLKIWIWCLLKASHKESACFKGRQKVIIKKGQFIMGSIKAKEELQLGISTLWYWLNILEKEGLVEIKKTNKYSIITIKNWVKYQETENKWNTDEQTDGTQMETYNNDKNDKNEKNIYTSDLTVAGVEEVLNIFYKINPTLNWGNKNTRKAAADLIKKFGLEGTLNMAEQICSVQGQPYAPVATTPYQMKEKLAQFKIYFDSRKNKKPKVSIIS